MTRPLNNSPRRQLQFSRWPATEVTTTDSPTELGAPDGMT